MTFLKKAAFLGLILLGIGANGAFGTDMEEMFEARAESFVVVKFSVQYEVDRETVTTYGLVVNNKGGVVVLPGSIPKWLPADRIQDVKIYPLGKKTEGFAGVYLGEDFRTSWNYFKAARENWVKLKSIAEWENGSPKVTDSVWGIGIMHLSDYFYKPMYMKAQVSAIEDVPYALAVCDNPVCGVGGPVFNEKGKFMGWATSGISTAYSLQMNGERYDVSLQRAQASEAFVTSKTLYKYLMKEPVSQLKREWPWMGLVGIEALDSEAAKFLGITKQSALVVSDVIEGGPAAEAGIEARDIITGVNGSAFKHYASNGDLPYAFHLQFAKYLPGKEITLSIRRGTEKMEVAVTLGKLPKQIKEAPREFYKDAGFTVREFVFEDAVQNHYYKMDYTGVIVQYVQPGSPADTAELEPGDWVKEIDSKTVISYDDAKKAIDTAIKDKNRDAIVFLVTRDEETKVVRVKLK